VDRGRREGRGSGGDEGQKRREERGKEEKNLAPTVISKSRRHGDSKILIVNSGQYFVKIWTRV